MRTIAKPKTIAEGRPARGDSPHLQVATGDASLLRFRRAISLSRPDGDSLDVSPHLAVRADEKAAMRICVVDEDFAQRERTSRVLRLEGYSVTSGGAGFEALAMLRRQAFDIVLADLFVSHLDSFDLLRAALATNRETLVVLVSPYATAESRIEVRRQGAWNYLLKPFSVAELKAVFTRATHAVWNARRERANGGVARILPPYHAARDQVIDQFECGYLGALISQARGNLSEAARMANIDRTTLYRLMERHGVRREPRDRVTSGGESQHSDPIAASP